MNRKILLNNSLAWAWFALAMLFAMSLILLWPGVMSSDAASQYMAAKAGIYSDHHPPLMSLLWRYLDRVYPGSGLMLTLHLLLLYAAAAIFVFLFRDSKFKWWYVIYPLLPNMLAYTSLIVKDTGFSYSYLLAGAILALLFIERPQKYKYLLLSAALSLLFYGSAVKFQAKYLLVFFCIAIAYAVLNYRSLWRSVMLGALIYAAMLIGINGLNAKLVPSAQQSHSWQLVKLYDLSAISLQLQQPLYPDFVVKDPRFDFAKVALQFKEHQVDPLVFYSGSVLRAGVTDQERSALWQYWWRTMREHPLLYLWVRVKLFKHNLITSPSEYKNPVEFLQTTSLAPLLAQAYVRYILDAAYGSFKILLRFIWLLPLLCWYVYLSVKYLKTSRYAAPLLLFSATSIALLMILLFFSMAGTARYVFLATCFVHAMHGFAQRVISSQSAVVAPAAAAQRSALAAPR